MVQLQQNKAKLDKANIQVIGISYDPVKTLSKFAKAKNIEFPLLSDPDSQAIKAYGILNAKAQGRIRGIPFPGTFVIDEKGVIRAKLFKEGYRARHSPADLIEAARSKGSDE